MITFARFYFLLLAFGLSISVPEVANASGEQEQSKLEALIQGFNRRQSAIASLLRGEKVGERNDGTLEAVGNARLTKDESQMIEEENADRRSLYELVARDRKQLPEDVAQAEAQKREAGLPEKVWRQNRNGDWYNRLNPPQRIVRRGAVMYDSPDVGGKVLRKDIPVYERFYVVEQQSGWCAVNVKRSPRKEFEGWIQSKDLVEWNNAICLKYAPRDTRARVVYFEDAEKLTELVNTPDAQRKAALEKIHKALVDGDSSGLTFTARWVEPQRQQTKEGDEHLLPVLGFRKTQVSVLAPQATLASEGGASTPQPPGSARGKDDQVKLVNVYADVEKAVSTAASPTVVVPKNPPPQEKTKADLVFVFDTTGSTGPYIEAAKAAVNQTLATITSGYSGASASSKGPPPDLKIGVWGYRDDPKIDPQIVYRTKNFTDQLVGVESFPDVLKAVVPVPVETPDEWAEDVFTGISDAITKTAWRDNSNKFVVLIGDASGKLPGEEGNIPGTRGNTCGYDHHGIQRLAADRKVTVMTIYIENSTSQAGREDQPRGEEQFRVMATSQVEKKADGTAVAMPPVFVAVPSTKIEQITNNLILGLGHLLENVPNAPQGEQKLALDKLIEKAELEGGAPVFGRGVDLAFNNMVTVDFKPNDTSQVLDMIAWTPDRDFVTPPDTSGQWRRPFSPCVALTKTQIAQLVQFLDDIRASAQDSSGTDDEDFVTRYRRTVGMALSEPTALLSNQPTTPRFLSALPYNTSLLSYSLQELDTKLKSSGFQRRFIEEMEAKRDRLFNAPKRLKPRRLSAEALVDELVYAVPLEDLP